MTSSARSAVLILFLSAVPASAQVPPAFLAEWLLQFDASAEKFIALAEAMPAERYTWSPGEGVMPVAQVYMHVSSYNYGYPADNLGIPAPAGVNRDVMEQERRKEVVLQALRQSMAHVRTHAERMTGEQLAGQTELYGRQVPSWSVLLQLLAHMNEHLGQSIAYARMNGIVPPWSR
jgi:uncharacterized damage-inducible protein DinB